MTMNVYKRTNYAQEYKLRIFLFHCIFLLITSSFTDITLFLHRIFLASVSFLLFNDIINAEGKKIIIIFFLFLFFDLIKLFLGFPKTVSKTTIKMFMHFVFTFFFWLIIFFLFSFHSNSAYFILTFN